MSKDKKKELRTNLSAFEFAFITDYLMMKFRYHH